jgi:hypothetical protein
MGASESTADNPDCRECQFDQEFAQSIGLDRCCGQPFWPTKDAKPKSVPPKLRIVTSRGGTVLVDKDKVYDRSLALHPPTAQQTRRSSASQASFSSRRSSGATSDTRIHYRFENGLPQNVPEPSGREKQRSNEESSHNSSSMPSNNSLHASNNSLSMYQRTNETHMNPREETRAVELSGYSLQRPHLDYSQVFDPPSTLDAAPCKQTQVVELQITPPKNDTHTRYVDNASLICSLPPSRHSRPPKQGACVDAGHRGRGRTQPPRATQHRQRRAVPGPIHLVRRRRPPVQPYVHRQPAPRPAASPAILPRRHRRRPARRRPMRLAAVRRLPAAAAVRLAQVRVLAARRRRAGPRPQRAGLGARAGLGTRARLSAVAGGVVAGQRGGVAAGAVRVDAAVVAGLPRRRRRREGELRLAVRPACPIPPACTVRPAAGLPDKIAGVAFFGASSRGGGYLEGGAVWRLDRGTARRRARGERMRTARPARGGPGAGGA